MMAAMAETRRADMFTEDGRPSDEDPRENGPTLGDERTTLAEALRCARLTLEMKCAGLDAEAMARRSVEPSTMSLLGLVRHLAEGERATFRVLMAGQDAPPLFCSDTDRDGDFDGAVPDPQVVAEAWQAWRAEVDFAERFVAGAPSLDITSEDPLNKHGSGGGAISLREVLVGMLWEYGRHMGHVDLLRERIDGRMGQLPARCGTGIRAPHARKLRDVAAVSHAGPPEASPKSRFRTSARFALTPELLSRHSYLTGPTG